MSGKLVQEAEVISVPSVPFTRTFHPIHHKEVIAVMKESIRQAGLEIVSSQYTLARDGMQVFAVWDLSEGNGEMCWSIGIRNSMNKSLALGIVSGTRVFVCSNLAFSGGFIEFRKHTKGLCYEELEFLAFRSTRRIIHNLTEFQAWHEGLKNYHLSDIDARLLLVDVMESGVFAPSKFARFCELYFGRCESTMFEFHEACTNILRGTNLQVMPRRNKILNGIIDNYIWRLDEVRNISPVGDFFEQRALSQAIPLSR